MKRFEFNDFANLTSSLNSYQRLVNMFSQITSVEPYKERLAELCKRDGKPYYDSNIVRNWADIEVHVVEDGWGSTSCGWGGIGGSAMTKSYTVTIVNRRNDLAFIYWDGKLAYVIKLEDLKDDYKSYGLWEFERHNIEPYYVNSKKYQV